MKKTILLSLLLLSVVLSACNETTDDVLSANVIFFTGNNNPNTITTLLDVPLNETIEMPEDPIRPGFRFVGWYLDVENTIPWDFETYLVESSVVFYAKWESEILTIIFDTNGGEIVGDFNTEFRTGEFRALPTVIKAGFNFVGWYPYVWVDESSTIPGDPGLQAIPRNQSEDLKIYAHWKAISVIVLFRSNYPISGQGPENPSTKNLSYEEIIDFPVLEDTDQYTFIGWNSNAAGTGTSYNNGEIFTRLQRLTLYAVWQPK